MSMLAARAGALGQLDAIGSITTGVSVLDSHRAGTASAFMGPEIAKLAVAGVDRKGYLDGAALQTFFAWLRPNDLIWGYVANNYLLGRTPPAFDILYWNADATRMSAGLLRDLADMAVSNALAEPDAMELLGTPIDLGRVDLRRVRRRRRRRPHHAVGELLLHHAAARRRHALRALERGPRRGARQSARQPEGALPHRAGGREPGVGARLGGGSRAVQRHLVGGLGALARRALRSRAPSAEATRRPRLQGARRGAWDLRARELSPPSAG